MDTENDPEMKKRVDGVLGDLLENNEIIRDICNTSNFILIIESN